MVLRANCLLRNTVVILNLLTWTGDFRLNLAVATRIYLMEPQWNPSVELQAIGRAQRLGQTDQVTIIRYIMTDTIEDVRLCARTRLRMHS
jgi:SWI/SNF-related matrix-associated actin-dependent regulator of chromatin subfamily A3